MGLISVGYREIGRSAERQSDDKSALGWKPQIDLETGIRLAYEDFLKKFPSQKTD